MRTKQILRKAIVDIFEEEKSKKDFIKRVMNRLETGKLPKISERQVRRIIKEYREVFDVTKIDKKKSGRKLSEKSKLAVQKAHKLLQKPWKYSHRKLGAKLGLTWSTYRYLRRTHLHLKEVRVFKQHAVPENSRPERLERVKVMWKKYAYGRNKYHYKDIIWSDESLFQVKETRNNKGKKIITLEEQNLPESYLTSEYVLGSTQIIVWIAWTYGSKVAIRIFESGTKVNAQVYKDFVLHHLFHYSIPHLQKKFPERKFVFQHDGARPHTAKVIQDYLSERCNNLQMNFIKANEWPPYSCDLTVMDYSFFGVFKRLVYMSKWSNISELCDIIQKCFKKLPNTLMDKAIDQFPKRIKLCIQNEGRPFEHLLKNIKK